MEEEEEKEGRRKSWPAMGWALSTVKKEKKMKGRKGGMRSGKERKEEEERKRKEIKLEEENKLKISKNTRKVVL